MTSSSATTMTLSQLITPFAEGVAADLVRQWESTQVSGVALDTRLLARGDVYLAMQGANAHGMQFIQSALDKGVSAVVVDEQGWSGFPDALNLLNDQGIPVVPVANLKKRSGDIAARCYGDPSQQLRIVAVTGTDGKTSVCRFISEALSQLGQPCGYIGTLGWGVSKTGEADNNEREASELETTELTTPDAAVIQQMLAKLQLRGATTVAMEASSHGIEEGRLDAVHVDVAVLTNFGRDHLDYHKSLSAYRAAKARLFSWPDLHSIVVNGDDELGKELAEKSPLRKILFFPSQSSESAVTNLATNDLGLTVDNVDLHTTGIRFDLLEKQPSADSVDADGERFTVSVPVMGSFNVSNLLACFGTLRALGHAANDASRAIENVQSVPGRIERFTAQHKPVAIVDYAHTPQALATVIDAVKQHCDGELWVVFGCGGDRDPGKRAPMGQAAELADHIIVTDDNPRTEQSATILQNIVDGMAAPERAIVIADRRSAIEHALGHAQEQDLVLIAGKGHEDYQIVGTSKHHFSDREEVDRFMQEAS